MVDPAKQLALFRGVDAVAAAAHLDLPQLIQGLAAFIVQETGAEQAFVLAFGADGEVTLSPDVPEVFSTAVQDVTEQVERPGEGFDDAGSSGAVEWRVIRCCTRLVGAALLLGDKIDEEALDVIFERAGAVLSHAIDSTALRDRDMELRTIYEIDRIRDEHLDFEEMLQRIMARILELVPGEAAVLALCDIYDVDDPRLRLHIRSKDGVAGGVSRAEGAEPCAVEQLIDAHRAEIEALVRDAFRRQELTEGHWESGHGALCMPLILDDEILGGFLLVSEQNSSFSKRDRRIFNAVCSQTDTAIFEDLQQQRIKDVFKRYVSADVFSEMMRRDDDFLRGRRRAVTCFFSDLRGFTSVSEQLDTDVVVDMLNEHLEAMTELVFRHGGTVDKFIGDCVMAFWGAPLWHEDHAKRAVACALEMRERHNEIAAGWAKRGLPGVKIGIGLHTGEVFVGNIGGEKMASYTIIGDNVNLASRLEGVSGPDDIIISSQTVEAIGEDVLELEDRGELTVKGKTVPTQIFHVVAGKLS